MHTVAIVACVGIKYCLNDSQKEGITRGDTLCSGISIQFEVMLGYVSVFRQLCIISRK